MSKDSTTDDDKAPGSDEQSPGSGGEKPAIDPRSAYPAILTAVELAEIMRVDRRVIYNMVEAHLIPGVRGFGRQFRFDRDVVLNWLRDGQGRAPRSTPRR
jgi:excisionase family DNA binding protein